MTGYVGLGQDMVVLKPTTVAMDLQAACKDNTHTPYSLMLHQQLP